MCLSRSSAVLGVAARSFGAAPPNLNGEPLKSFLIIKPVINF